MGHHALLEEAFRVAHRVSIGLATTRYLRQHPKPLPSRIQSYASRKRALLRFLQEKFPGRVWSVVPLEDRFGGSLLPGPDLIVVSPATRSGAAAVNRERARRGLPALHLRIVPLRLGEDGKPVSSRRIRAGLVSPDGRRKVHRSPAGRPADGNVPPSHLS